MHDPLPDSTSSSSFHSSLRTRFGTRRARYLACLCLTLPASSVSTPSAALAVAFHCTLRFNSFPPFLRLLWPATVDPRRRYGSRTRLVGRRALREPDPLVSPAPAADPSIFIAQGKESDEIDVQQSATSVKVFVPGAEVKWTAQTHSAKMREFVESRELIFERQRELDLREYFCLHR